MVAEPEASANTLSRLFGEETCMELFGQHLIPTSAPVPAAAPVFAAAPQRAGKTGAAGAGGSGGGGGSGSAGGGNSSRGSGGGGRISSVTLTSRAEVPRGFNRIGFGGDEEPLFGEQTCLAILGHTNHVPSQEAPMAAGQAALGQAGEPAAPTAVTTAVTAVAAVKGQPTVPTGSPPSFPMSAAHEPAVSPTVLLVRPSRSPRSECHRHGAAVRASASFEAAPLDGSDNADASFVPRGGGSGSGRKDSRGASRVSSWAHQHGGGGGGGGGAGVAGAVSAGGVVANPFTAGPTDFSGAFANIGGRTRADSSSNGSGGSRGIGSGAGSGVEGGASGSQPSGALSDWGGGGGGGIMGNVSASASASGTGFSTAFGRADPAPSNDLRGSKRRWEGAASSPPDARGTATSSSAGTSNGSRGGSSRSGGDGSGGGSGAKGGSAGRKRTRLPR
ncbi:unnamed protein product, partial [Phaeothamnion confervicola]